MPSSSYLCSFHIPKTGGTTFASHARKSLGGAAFLLHGPFSRMDRFMQGLPQVEELTDREREEIRIVHGHGAGLSLAAKMTGRMPEFMVIMRDPYDRFVSGFNHFNSERAKSGLDLSSEEKYFHSRGGNYYAKTFEDQFSPLISSAPGLSLEKIMPVLQSIKYFILTEYLDQQLGEICRLYGLDTGAIEARRINKSKAAPTIDRELFYTRNEVDRQIFSAVESAATRSSYSIENPFGYKPERFQDYLREVWSKQSQQARLAEAYDELVVAAQKTLKLQAMYLKLTAGTATHVVEKSQLLERTQAAMPGWLASLGDAELSMASFWSGAMFIKEGDSANAEKYLRESIRLNPKNDNALAHLAKILYRSGMKDAAIELINRALALQPARQITQAVSKLIFKRA
jgi:hypothetical protein